ncbi:MAG: complex I subunit 1/NuoH family protein, partial [Terriglobales bacterium]
KEDLVPAGVYKPLFIAAPMMSMAVALMSIAVIPIGETVAIPWLGVETPLQITDVNIGLLFLLGVGSLGVYGVALAGWSSNSKYSLLGSLRASAQMVSYELSLGVALIGVVVLAGTLSLREIVDLQAGAWFGLVPKWNIFRGQIVGFFVFLTAAFAETNRIPFDLPESETELVAGYHTEYSSMKFAMFFMAEYTNMFTVACVGTLLFFGGWHGPVFGPPALRAVLPVFWFATKVFGFIFLYIWIRGTLPRFRYDQLMAFGWKVLLPLAIANVMLTALVVALRNF